ncbi:MAG: hypothetical protein CYG60_04840 [Actinobacteria bacterium]|nr:hypothetical protein [Actinomycetota bacterium]PLS86906.1 MAG: hypothetical protein CYG60_04840 [Actinomycetota bacterium]
MTSNDDSNRIEKQAHRYAEYEAHDQKGEPVGHVDDLFVDTVNGQEYVELNMGVLGLRSTIVPLEVCTVDEERMIVAIPFSRTKLRRAPRKRAPILGDEVMAITPEYEDRIRGYFGLEPIGPPTEERPFRAFSTAYPSGGETPKGEVRPVEVRRIASRPVESEAVRPQASDESEATEVRPVEARVVQPGAVEAQDAESVEPEVVVGAQDSEAAEPEIVESREADEPEAIDLAAAEDENVEVRAVEPEVLEPVDAGADAPPVAEEEAPAPVGETAEAGDAEVSDEPTGDAGAADLAPAEVTEASSPSEEVQEEPVEVTPEADEQAGPPTGDEAPQVAATARMEELETAGQQMTEAARQSFQALADRAVKAQQSNLELSQSVAQTLVEQLQGQTQGNRQATQTLQQQGQRQQQALQTVVQGSVSAYTNLLTSTFSLYQQTLESATRIAVGNFQVAARLGQPMARVPAAGLQAGVEAAAQSTEAAGQVAGGGSAEDEQAPPRQGEQTASSSEDQSGDAGQTPQGGAQETSPTAEQPVERTVSQADAASGDEAPAQSGTETGEYGLEIDAAAPMGATESSDPLLPPPPEVPNILDELPPAPQVQLMDDPSSDRRPQERE